MQLTETVYCSRLYSTLKNSWGIGPQITGITKFLVFFKNETILTPEAAGNTTTGQCGKTISYYQNTTQPNISQTDRLCLTRGGLLKALAYVWGKGSSIPPIFLLVVLVLGTQIEMKSFLKKNSYFLTSQFQEEPV